MNEDLLYAVFKHFDTDNTNFITHYNLKEAFAKIGRYVTKEQINEMIK